jgi:cell division septal protein FtsQ
MARSRVKRRKYRRHNKTVTMKHKSSSSLKKPRLFKMMIWLFPLCLLGTAAYLSIQHGIPFIMRHTGDINLFRIRAIEARGCVHSDSLALVKAFPVKKGESIFIEDSLLKAPFYTDQVWIKDVEVKRSLFGRVTLEVTEREPFVLVNLDKIFVCDEEGVLLSAKSRYYRNLVLVSGLSSVGYDIGDTLDKQLFAKCVRFLKQLREKDEALYNSVSEVKLTAPGEYEIFMAAEKVRLRISENEPENQVERYSRIKDQIICSGSEEIEIDLRFKNLIFVNKES